VKQEVVINYRMVQNKRSRGSSFKFVPQKWFEMSQNYDKNYSQIPIKHDCSLPHSH